MCNCRIYVAHLCCSGSGAFPTLGKFTENLLRPAEDNRKLVLKRGLMPSLFSSRSPGCVQVAKQSLSQSLLAPMLLPPASSLCTLTRCCSASPAVSASPSSPVARERTLWVGLYGDQRMPNKICLGTCVFPLHPSLGLVLT